MPNIKPLRKLVTTVKNGETAVGYYIGRGLLRTIDDHEESPERNPFK